MRHFADTSYVNLGEVTWY